VTTSSLLRAAVVGAFITLSASAAQACGVCVTTMADHYLPPISLWCGIAVLWFLGNSSISSHYGIKIKGVPTFGWALLILLLFLFFGVGIFGFVAFLPLGLLANVTFTRLLSPKSRHFYPAPLIAAIHQFGFTLIVAIAVLSLVSLKLLTDRPPAQANAQWRESRMRPVTSTEPE
jgi:hypothetical protein